MKRLKILWLSHLIPYPPKGGVLQRSYNLIKELAKYHDVYLLAFNQTKLLNTHFNSTEEGEFKSKKHFQDFCLDVDFLPIPSELIPFSQYRLALKGLFSPLGYTNEWLQSKEMETYIKSWSEKYSFDFVHFDTISLAPFKALFPNTPSSLDHHNIESHMMLRRAKQEKNILKKFYFLQEGFKIESYEKKMAPHFEVNITCSQLDNERLQALVPHSQCVEIANGVDLNYFTPTEPRTNIDNIESFKVVFAGRLNAYTNQKAAKDLVYKIWPTISEKFPKAQCILVGSNPPEDLVQLSKNKSWLQVTGYVDDVRPYIEDADLYICPITDGGGTKLKVLDALSMGIPLIADPIACEGIKVTEGIDVLFAKSSKEYLLQIIKLINSKSLYLNLSSEGRKTIETHYSYESIGKELSCLVNKYYIENPVT